MMLRKASVMSNQDDAGTVTAGGYQAVPPSVLPGQGFLDSSNAGFDGFSPAAEPMFVAPDGPYIDVEATEGANPDASSRSAVLKQLTAALTAVAPFPPSPERARAHTHTAPPGTCDWQPAPGIRFTSRWHSSMPHVQ